MATASARFTHLALPVSDLDRSIAFYERWASMKVLDPPHQTMGTKTVGMSDQDGSFVLSLIESSLVETIEGNFHLGIALSSREDVTRLAAQAKEQGLLRLGPADMGQPLGAWAILSDPDGHAVELSFGQQTNVS